MAKVIAFINEKGGIGKTSCCFNAAWELSKKKKILLIDMDGQKANLSYFCGVQKEDDMITIFNVLNNGTSITQAIRQVVRKIKKGNTVEDVVKDNLYVVPANAMVSNLNQTAKTSRFKKALEEIRDEYDYIFIDVCPTPNWSHFLTLSCSNYIIIPMLPDITSLEANKGIAESVQEVKETTNPNLKVMGIIFNRYTNRTNLSKQVEKMANKIAEQLDTQVFESKIRQAVVLSECVHEHIGITEYAAKSDVANDIVTFVKEIERKCV